MGKVLDMQDRLWAVRDCYPALFARHFHSSLLILPRLRLAPKTEPPPGIRELGKEASKRRGRRPWNWDKVQNHAACIVAGTPKGIYRMVKGRHYTPASTKYLLQNKVYAGNYGISRSRC